MPAVGACLPAQGTAGIDHCLHAWTRLQRLSMVQESVSSDLWFLHLLHSRGGLIFWADLVGAPKIVAKLNALSKMVGGDSLTPLRCLCVMGDLG
jgi:hypothetical protein